MGQKKQRRRIRGRAIALFLILLLLGALCYAAYVLLRVEAIHVEGNEIYTKSQIEELSGIEIGAHLFELDLDQVEANIATNPYIRVEDVSRVWWPPAVSIAIAERTVAAAIRTSDGLVYIDKDAWVLEIAKEGELSGKLEVVGVSVTGYAVNQPLSTDDAYKITSLQQVLSTLEKQDVKLYSALDIHEPLDVRLYTADGITVKLGQVTELEKKILLANTAILEFKGMGINAGTLDVSNASDAALLPEIKAATDTDAPATPTDAGDEDDEE